MTVTFEIKNFINPIAVIHNSGITHYFGNYFGFQTNLINFILNKLFRSKTRNYAYVLAFLYLIFHIKCHRHP